MRTLRTATLLLVGLTLLTGVVYPLLVTGVARLLFPRQANGSVLTVQGRAVGSALIGQGFESERYFWSRPSATSPVPYNASASGGSNLGPTNPALLDRIAQEVKRLERANSSVGPVPGDLATTSASGLDPHISPAAAEWQVERVARSRGLTATTLRSVVARYTEGRQLGFLGEQRVNVLELNLALEGMSPDR